MTLCDITYSLSNQLNQLYAISVKSHLKDEITMYVSAHDFLLTEKAVRILEPKWQTIEFPILISELPCDAILTLILQKQTVNVNIFNDSKLLRNGAHAINFGKSEFPQLQILETKLRQYERGELPKDQPLDDIILPKIYKEMEDLYKQDLHVQVQFPLFKFPVIYNEEFVDNKAQYFSSWYDPQVYLENIIEEKHRRLVRDTRSGFVDKTLKPNLKTRDDLNRIIAMPCTKQLNGDERDLIWSFRFYLLKNKAACTKFISSVYWNDIFERKQAIELLTKWEELSFEDSLELLGSEYQDEFIRQFAVSRLYKTTNKQIAMYMIQLVQVIKYEFVVDGSLRIPVSQFTRQMELECLNTSPLIKFLISKCCIADLFVPFYWQIVCEMEDSKFGILFRQLEQFFFKQLDQDFKDAIRRQLDLVKYLSNITASLKLSKEHRLRKIEWLQEALSDPKNGLNVFPPMIWLLQPSTTITGMLPEKASAFKSALQPLKLTFTCQEGFYTCIFKSGDDMRQDALCLQMISLMDQLLLLDNLDLKIKTYSVIPTSDKIGFAEFIESKPLSVILDEYNGTLYGFLLNKNETVIANSVMDTYLRSSAGYCVMTFVLGVGDRHLDNVLLTKQGEFFHVDYAYILGIFNFDVGLDPKPYPPFMKICKEMVELMGGLQHPNYLKFKQYCFTAYSILRKHSKLIIQLFLLMKDANLPSIQQDPEQSVIKIQDKFRLDLNEKNAIDYFDQLITESATALFPQVLETIHRFAQYWRR